MAMELAAFLLATALALVPERIQLQAPAAPPRTSRADPGSGNSTTANASTPSVRWAFPRYFLLRFRGFIKKKKMQIRSRRRCVFFLHDFAKSAPRITPFPADFHDHLASTHWIHAVAALPGFHTHDFSCSLCAVQAGPAGERFLYSLKSKITSNKEKQTLLSWDRWRAGLAGGVP
jgi:hypothetical protein